VFKKIFYGVHPEMMHGVSNETLRDRHLNAGLFETGEITLAYSHSERFVIGGAVTAVQRLELPLQAEPESAAVPAARPSTSETLDSELDAPVTGRSATTEIRGAAHTKHPR
jgi:hypothetical protein